MSQSGDILRSIYRSIDDELHRDRQDDEDVSDEDMDIADQKAFAHWEVQLVSRAPQNYDFDTRDPALRRAVEEGVRSQVNFFHSSSTGDEYDGHQSDDNGLDDFDELGYEESRQASSFDDPTHFSWWPSNPKGWRSIVDQLTRFNTGFEDKKQLDDVAGPVEPNQGSAKADHNSIQTDHYEILYDLLVSHAVCPASNHSALLQLQSLDQSPETLDIYLSCFPGNSIQKHKTSIRVERLKRKRERARIYNPHQDLNICHEIRTLYKAQRRRLYLVFDDSGIQPGKDPWREILPLPPGPRTICLSDVLRSDSLKTEDLRMTLKKSRLALELALSVHRMYAGPWIQHTLDARVVQLVYEDDGAPYGDFTFACIPCELTNDWKSINKIWLESQLEINSRQTSSEFFLSLAQLLVDILLGKRREPPLANDWHGSLIEEAERMMQNRFLKWYGKAVLACVQFTLDYHVARGLGYQSKGHDSTVIARDVILRNIVQNLWDHFHFWRRQYDHQVSECNVPRQEILETSTADASPGSNVSKIPFRKASEVQMSFFTLFSPGDEIYEKVTSEKQLILEFDNLMSGFKNDFVLPASYQTHLSDAGTIKPPAVVIAVLDTGVCIDESDVMLWAGCDTRLRREYSRNFFNPKDRWEGWDNDNHGHGTHIVRILLRNTVNAEIVVLKVADGRKMEYTAKMLDQFIQALKWAGEHADIINISLGLDGAAKGKMQRVIDDIVTKKGKLIFAAASNSGGNGVRAYPATGRGVFAIHATKGNGSHPEEDMNPPAQGGGMDNFATLGCGIPSRWKGDDVLISGTSFATPIAAAIAANALEFARLAPAQLQSSPGYFSSYRGMRHLLQMMSSKVGNYDYIRPWADGMFRSECRILEMQEKLQRFSRYDC